MDFLPCQPVIARGRKRHLSKVEATMILPEVLVYGHAAREWARQRVERRGAVGDASAIAAGSAAAGTRVVGAAIGTRHLEEERALAALAR
jgi:hypothetical protein